LRGKGLRGKRGGPGINKQSTRKHDLVERWRGVVRFGAKGSYLIRTDKCRSRSGLTEGREEVGGDVRVTFGLQEEEREGLWERKEEGPIFLAEGPHGVGLQEGGEKVKRNEGGRAVNKP